MAAKSVNGVTLVSAVSSWVGQCHVVSVHPVPTRRRHGVCQWRLW